MGMTVPRHLLSWRRNAGVVVAESRSPTVRHTVFVLLTSTIYVASTRRDASDLKS